MKKLMSLILCFTLIFSSLCYTYAASEVLEKDLKHLGFTDNVME